MRENDGASDLWALPQTNKILINPVSISFHVFGEINSLKVGEEWKMEKLFSFYLSFFPLTSEGTHTHYLHKAEGNICD